MYQFTVSVFRTHHGSQQTITGNSIAPRQLNLIDQRGSCCSRNIGYVRVIYHNIIINDKVHAGYHYHCFSIASLQTMQKEQDFCLQSCFADFLRYEFT